MVIIDCGHSLERDLKWWTGPDGPRVFCPDCGQVKLVKPEELTPEPELDTLIDSVMTVSPTEMARLLLELDQPARVIPELLELARRVRERSSDA